MELSKCWTEIEGVPLTARVDEVFDRLCRHPDWPFLPVLDEKKQPVGVVREWDLKTYAYSRFGRELVKRCQLSELTTLSLILPCDVSRDELLGATSRNPNPDGIVITENGVYRAALLTPALLRMFETSHVETQVRLAQAQKMEALGTLAGGIAHDLNNILTPILGYTDLIREMIRDHEPVDPDLLGQMRVCIKRATQTVGQILSFSRHQKNESGSVALSGTIKEVMRLMQTTLPSTIEIETQIEAEKELVWVNATEMHQVLMNLCTNAYHAMKGRRGQLRVTLERHHGPLLGWSMHNGELPGALLRLTVSDSGEGIAPDVLPRIFDPFFTTKKQGEGTGMGLAIVHGIVTRCKGFVSVETEQGKGSSFHVYLPVCQAGATRAAAPMAPAVTPATAWKGRKARALLVDDEFHITRMAGKLLPKYGIDVETENDSIKAAAILEERIAEFDVLITDQTMPSITGIELAKKALTLRPSLPVILCTGYTDVPNDMVKNAGIRSYLFKPPDYQEMARLIHGWLSPNAPGGQVGNAPTRGRIVVLEDDPMVGKMYLKLIPLHFPDYEVVSFADGVRAFGYLKENMADLIVMDLNVPRMDAGQLLLNLRDVYGRRAQPVPSCLFCSGVGHALEAIHEHCGHNLWRKLLKPYALDEFVTAARELLKPACPAPVPVST